MSMYFNEQTAKQLTLVATLRARKEKIDDLKQALLSLMDKTRAEEGSVTYHLYVDRDDSQNFIFHETWASQELWEKHMESSHIKNFFAGRMPFWMASLRCSGWNVRWLRLP